jgi:hypothetical protein
LLTSALSETRIAPNWLYTAAPRKAELPSNVLPRAVMVPPLPYTAPRPAVVLAEKVQPVRVTVDPDS